MTVCIAYRSNNDIVFVSDSLVTKSGISSDRYNKLKKQEEKLVTSTGEVPNFDNKSVTYEGILKMTTIGDICLNFAGNIKRATDFIIYLEVCMNLCRNPFEAIDIAFEGTKEEGTQPHKGIWFTFGFIHEDTPRLCYFTPACKKIKESKEDILIFGSLTNNEKRKLESFIRNLDNSFTCQKKLISTIAFLHRLGVQKYLPEQNVGGSFYGACVKKDGTFKHSSLMLAYINGPPLSDEEGSYYEKLRYNEVVSFFEEDIFVLFSTHCEQPRVFIPVHWERTEENKQKLIRQYQNAKRCYNSLRFNYLVLIFINTQDSITFIIQSRKKKTTAGYELFFIEERKCAIGLNPDLISKAIRPQSDFMFFDVLALRNHVGPQDIRD